MAFGKEIKRLRDNSRLSVQRFVDLVGIDNAERVRGWEKNDTTPKYEDRIKIETFFQLPLEEIMKLESIPETILSPKPYHELRKENKLNDKNPNEIVFTNADFSAGTSIEFYDDTQMIQSAYTMDIPEFKGTVAFRAYGDSMEPTIKSGSIVFATKIEDWNSHLEYGQVYGIVCTDNRRYLKYIRRSKHHETHFLLKSENKEYDDFELPKISIKNIWLIHGWLNKRT